MQGLSVLTTLFLCSEDSNLAVGLFLMQDIVTLTLLAGPVGLLRRAVIEQSCCSVVFLRLKRTRTNRFGTKWNGVLLLWMKVRRCMAGVSTWSLMRWSGKADRMVGLEAGNRLYTHQVFCDGIDRGRIVGGGWISGG